MNAAGAARVEWLRFVGILTKAMVTADNVRAAKFQICDGSLEGFDSYSSFLSFLMTGFRIIPLVHEWQDLGGVGNAFKQGQSFPRMQTGCAMFGS